MEPSLPRLIFSSLPSSYFKIMKTDFKEYFKNFFLGQYKRMNSYRVRKKIIIIRNFPLLSSSLVQLMTLHSQQKISFEATTKLSGKLSSIHFLILFFIKNSLAMSSTF